MAQQFGKTWWGNEWLRSLTHIDYENRIPRGATYARNGYVKSLMLKDCTITARVAGSRPTPYKVSIKIPAFSSKQVDMLIKALMARPGLISHLLNRELDPEILSVARDCGLKIFPERWNDLDMSCNCPDWAVPCKHLAAVVYMFSREIDNNPFIVLQMHGLDLLEELKKRGMETQSMHQEVAVPGIMDIIQVKKAKDVSQETPPFRRIDFSKLTDCSDALLMLLQDNPPFSPAGNFKNDYANELKKIKNKILRLFTNKANISSSFPTIDCCPAEIGTDTELGLYLDATLHWTVSRIIRQSSIQTYRPQHKGIYNCQTIIPTLFQINPDFLPDYHPSVIALYQSLYCALHLLNNGAIAPQLLKLPDETYTIRWIPLDIDQDVKKLMTALEDTIPDTLIQMRPEGRKTYKCINRKGEWLVSFFLGILMKHLSSENVSNPFTLFFFKGRNQAFNGIGEKETPGGIKSWTASYTLTSSDYRPVFSVEENPHGGFDLHIGIEDKREKAPRVISLHEILEYPEYDHERFFILRSFTILSKIMDEVNRYINDGACQPIHYTEKTFVPFLLQIIPAVRMLDIRIFMPKSLQQLIRPKASLSIKRKSGSEKGFLNLADLFAFDWQVALGKDLISVEKFKQLLQKADGLIKFKQHYIYADADILQKLHHAFTQTEHLTPAQLLQAALTEEYKSARVHLTDEVRELIRELTRQEAVAVPAGLKATLRPYQERGFSWMYRNMRIGFGSILADDMGLGKTLQAITLILKLKEDNALQEQKALIIAPTGLLTNWEAEIGRFAPSLSVFTYHGTGRDLKQFDADILLTTYGILRSDTAKIKKRPWAVMFIDEAQNIKNQDTAQSKAVRAIPARTHIALSGTPVENRLTEFWSIMEYANKGYLDSLKNFKDHFATPIQLYQDADCISRFRKVTAPFIMRRMKTDKSIIADLPEKIELDDYASLQVEQAALYNQTLEAAMAEIEGITTTDHESLFKRQGLILQMILALKQICNHPALFLKNGDYRTELSGKAEMLLDRIEGIVAGNEKVLVFTQFREMGDILVRMIEEHIGMRPLFYHGGCSINERKEMVDRFQNNHTDKIFILSLKAAGTGLNLTAASHVIHYDLWWNPAVESQATDRAYRIGQHKNVMVHRFITKNSFEERINDMIQQKKHLADMTVASGESWIGKLSNKELREIFG